MNRDPVLLVALGGNALIRKGETGTLEQQFDNLRIPLLQIAELSKSYRIIITHGNGPQVGNLLLQQECASVPALPLEILVAQTQGQLGYMIESTLDEILSQEDDAWSKYLVSLISYVVVDRDDPAFQDPTKPIGPVFTAEEAGKLPYPTRETAKGFRRVVASPKPVTIVEKREIKKLIETDFIVICCGGGGIPVVREGRGFAGVDAVIDKDLAAAKLAEEVGVDLLLIATDVPGAALDYGTEKEDFLRRIQVDEAESLVREGRFPTGSMGPKMQAGINYIRKSGGRAVICSVHDLLEAEAGRAGTEIIP